MSTLALEARCRRRCLCW